MKKLCLYVTLKQDVLDPQGKAIHLALENIGFKNIIEIRQSKIFEVKFKDKVSLSKAKKELLSMGNKLLANTVIEDYKIIQEETLK